MRRGHFVHPTEHDPRHGERIVMGTHNVLAQPTNDVAQEAIAFDRLRPRLHNPISIQRDDDLLAAARLKLDVNVCC